MKQAKRKTASLRIIQENINALTRDRHQFLDHAKESEKKFTGPSKHFYLKVIKKIRATQNYSTLFDNTDFIEDLYATLATWGMNRMESHPRMVEFDDFRASIDQNKEKFLSLMGKCLTDVEPDSLRNQIKDLFQSLDVMKGDEPPKLVANSKMMHYMLPDLIPPIDGGQVIPFFFGKRFQAKKEDEWYVFWKLYLRYSRIANKLHLTDHDLQGEWNTSVPKLIDNAIIGYNIQQKKLKKVSKRQKKRGPK